MSKKNIKPPLVLTGKYLTYFYESTKITFIDVYDIYAVVDFSNFDNFYHLYFTTNGIEEFIVYVQIGTVVFYCCLPVLPTKYKLVEKFDYLYHTRFIY